MAYMLVRCLLERLKKITNCSVVKVIMVMVILLIFLMTIATGEKILEFDRS